MNDLLIGCRVIWEASEWIVLRTKSTEKNSFAWCMKISSGEMGVMRIVDLKVSSTDMERILIINKHINQFREKTLDMVSRAELIDFD